MPDNGRFSEEEIEQALRDLGSRVEYPRAPDVASTVRLRLEEERGRRAPHRPPFLAPRWTAIAAAVVLVCVLALSPTIRATLSDFLVPGYPGGGPAAVEDEAAQGCPSPSIRARPARAAAGAAFRLRGHGFSSGCDGVAPARGIAVHFLQAGETRKLATLDADSDLTFDTRLRVPDGAEPGPATVLVTARSGEPARTRFVVLR
jgi:hypothetical protein